MSFHAVGRVIEDNRERHVRAVEKQGHIQKKAKEERSRMEALAVIVFCALTVRSDGRKQVLPLDLDLNAVAGKSKLT